MGYYKAQPTVTGRLSTKKSNLPSGDTALKIVAADTKLQALELQDSEGKRYITCVSDRTTMYRWLNEGQVEKSTLSAVILPK